MKQILSILLILIHCICYSQNTFESDPLKAEFITSDIPRFWEAFSRMDTEKNPYKKYLDEGSIGLNDFIKYRIESANNLKRTVKKKRAEYDAIREGSMEIENYTDQIRGYYLVFKELNANAVFPPTYFVIGAFNSGGTASKNGLIVGIEMQKEIKDVPYMVAHELIHFNQNYQIEKNTLLSQSIREGSADLIGQIISGTNINGQAYKYGEENEELLCREFVNIMNDTKYHGWLYGSSGKKEGRPNDLGYWMGYKISNAYYQKSKDKEKAIQEILNISDAEKFMRESGYLEPYLK